MNDMNLCRHDYCRLHDALTERPVPHINAFTRLYVTVEAIFSTHTCTLQGFSSLHPLAAIKY